MSYQIRWEALADKDVRKTFPDSILALFLKLMDCTVDMEPLFKEIAASSVARVMIKKYDI